MIHAVTWHDGERWLAALDASEADGEGVLAEQTPLADFAQERKYGTFSREDACNFGVHFYDGGAILSIVVECGTFPSSSPQIPSSALAPFSFPLYTHVLLAPSLVECHPSVFQTIL